MKKQFLLLSAISFLIFSCNDKPAVTVAPTKRTIDTTLIYGVYLGYQKKGQQFGLMKRFIYDSVEVWNIRGKDSTEAKKTWGKDSAYVGEIFIPVRDTLTAKAVGIKDWNGKDTVVTRVDWISKAYVYDIGLTTTAATNKLKQYMDTTKPKVDSLTNKK